MLQVGSSTEFLECPLYRFADRDGESIRCALASSYVAFSRLNQYRSLCFRHASYLLPSLGISHQKSFMRKYHASNTLHSVRKKSAK
jgi:hypothetical protein